jgi:hypothetical protein
MLYYRLYKRMKKSIGFRSAVSFSFEDFTFIFLIPILVGVIVADIFYTYFWASDELATMIFLLPMFCAGLYIYFCAKFDKDP